MRMSSSWREKARYSRARRALDRQLLYQQKKADAFRSVGGLESEVVERRKRTAQDVRTWLEQAGKFPARARLLEVGSGSTGLIFYFDDFDDFASRGLRVGVDPLAVEYAHLFPNIQRQVATCAASGETLPFSTASFDVVLCDNVIDHAENPGDIVRELGRVLKPDGLLYFSVNVHHPFYRYASWAHAACNIAGVPLEIGPFADHTVHLTLADVRQLLRALPFRIVFERDGIDAARTAARVIPPRHFGDRLKRLFFKNARYEVLAVRQAEPGRPTTIEPSKVLDSSRTRRGAS
jgi:SAM-dependent methyltransferase